MKRTWWGLTALAIMVIALALPAQAASFKIGASDWTLGGSVRLDTGWQISDYGDSDFDDETDFFLENPGDSRINAQAVYGKMTAFAELGLGNTRGGTDVGVRHLYATYTLGGGNSILLGRTWTCLAEDSPNQLLWGGNAMFGFGDLFAGRHDQIRFIHAQDKLTFQVAIEDAKGAEPADVSTTVGGFDVSTENIFPALVMSMGYDDGKLAVTPSLYVQTFKFKVQAPALNIEEDEDITSYALACDASINLNALKISGEIWWGQNLSTLGLDMRGHGASTAFGGPVLEINAATGAINLDDANSYGGWVQLAAKVKPGTLYVGAGYQQADTEMPGAGFEDEISTWGAFINYAYPIAKNFTITPELAYFNCGDDANKNLFGAGANELGSETFIGVHFQYDF